MSPDVVAVAFIPVLFVSIRAFVLIMDFPIAYLCSVFIHVSIFITVNLLYVFLEIFFFYLRGTLIFYLSNL